jgi:hypothetical protein
MKKFLIKVFCFMLPLLVTAIVLEFYLRSIPNNYRYKSDYLDEHSNRVETLILGSSHTFYGINPQFMQKNTFNVAFSSQSLEIDFEILKKYQNKFDNLKVVILPISYFTLGYDLSISVESWRYRNYVLYFHLDIAKNLLDYSEVFSKINSKWGNRLLFDILSSSSTNSISQKNFFEFGYCANGKNSSDLQKTGKTAAERHTCYSQHEFYVKNTAILNSIYDFCNQRNIKLVLITTPTYYTYRENLDKIQLDKMNETINNFIEIHKEVVYLNYFECADFIAKDFYDADHLNEFGAEKFTKKLAKDINSILQHCHYNRKNKCPQNKK